MKYTTTVADYLTWRGDIPFSVDPFNEVDNLVLCIISYINFRRFPELLTRNPREAVSLRDICQKLTQEDEQLGLSQLSYIPVAQQAAQTERFAGTRMFAFEDRSDQETQFAAVTFLLPDKSVFVAFRGTDTSLVGWKEDLSMSFRSVIPSQALAKQYLQDVLVTHSGPVRVSGHSKGGNVAVYAVSQSAPVIRDRVLEVYNQEGPGFSAEFLEDPGYQATLPKIRTYLPQGSMIGVVLYRAEPVIIVQSHETGIMQHDPFSWDICGTAITRMDALNANSQFFRLTMENWLAGFDMDDRVRLVNMLYDLLTSGDVEVMDDVLQPKSLINYVARLRGSELIRKYLASDLNSLLKAARRARLQMIKGQ